MELLLITAPLLVALIYGGAQLKARRDLARRVDLGVDSAARAMADARAKQVEMAALRIEAFGRFDALEREEGERLWSRAQSRGVEVGGLLGRATQELETALFLDRGRSDVRERFADLLFERALFAEERGATAERDEFVLRLALYDEGGARSARWGAPARVSLRVIPVDADIALARVVSEGALRKPVLVPSPWQAGQAELAPGSYVVTLRAAGYADTKLPFFVTRNERVSFSVELPREEEVPRGYVYVPPGRFLFGSGAEDSFRRGFFHTVPLHEVSTKGYLIAVFETTFGEWLEFLGTVPVKERSALVPRVEKGGFQGALALTELATGGWQLRFQPTSKSYTARSGERIVYEGRSRRSEQDWLKFPVFGVSVAEARAYVGWLQRSKRVVGARLCTEYEWEHAARGADGREYPHGDALDPEDANIDETYGKLPPAMGPDEVGSHPRSESPFGLQDMAGNVWEWTQSSLVQGEYAARGGSYYFDVNASRTTEREVTEPDFRDVTVGVRVCADRP